LVYKKNKLEKNEQMRKWRKEMNVPLLLFFFSLKLAVEMTSCGVHDRIRDCEKRVLCNEKVELKSIKFKVKHYFRFLWMSEL